jgi:hypothetical protein
LGPEEFEQKICPLVLAWERYGRWRLQNELMAERVVRLL